MRIEKNTYFTSILCAFLLWIGIANVIKDIYMLSIILSIISILFYIYSTQYRHVKACLIFILIFGWIGMWYSLYRNITMDTNIQLTRQYIGLYVSMEWEVKELHKRSDYYDEYILQLGQIHDKKISSKIMHLLRLPKNFTIYPGQVISYSGKIYPIENFNGFSYKDYMLSKGIYFSSSTSVIDTISHHRYWWKYHFYTYRQKLLSTIENMFPSQEAIFLGWILFWARENIPAELKEDFNNSWLTHFIAVSGFNITLCIIFVTFLLGFLPPVFRVIIVSLTIVWFSVFVGLGAPVVRAAIMGIIGYMFLQTGNNAKNITLLAFTATCMILWSPMSLNYDVSLHLSFLAVIGIIYTQDYFQNIFSWIPNIFAIREAFVLTLSALSFSLPIMMFQFGQVSLLAPFSNIAITWTIPLAMLGWVIALIADFIHPVLGDMMWFLEWILLHYDMLVVRFFWNIEWALLKVDFWPYAIYLEIMYFIILIYVLALHNIKKKISEK